MDDHETGQLASSLRKGDAFMTESDPGYADVTQRASWKAWALVAVLFLAYVCSFLDRVIIGLMVEPLKAEFSMTDTQIGLLQGLAFALFYTLMGLPIGWLVDRYSRIRIASLGIIVWSVMTALGAAAQNFTHLFAARVGVGIGEASLSPAT